MATDPEAPRPSDEDRVARLVEQVGRHGGTGAIVVDAEDLVALLARFAAMHAAATNVVETLDPLVLGSRP